MPNTAIKVLTAPRGIPLSMMLRSVHWASLRFGDLQLAHELYGNPREIEAVLQKLPSPESIRQIHFPGTQVKRKIRGGSGLECTEHPVIWRTAINNWQWVLGKDIQFGSDRLSNPDQAICIYE